MKESLKNSIDKYLRSIKNDDWIRWEAYKFEFANFIHANVKWVTQTDEEILAILVKSQKIKYSAGAIGIQFIQKSGRDSMSQFITIKDIGLLQRLISSDVLSLNWNDRGMSYTALSAWISSLFPDKLIPIPQVGFNETINYLFDSEHDKFPKRGLEYVIQCQPYFQETINILRLYPFEGYCLKIWNEYYEQNEELNIPTKSELSDLDWAWLAQDFHLFVHRNILGLYKEKGRKVIIVQEEDEPKVFEGNSVLASHMRYERNLNFIRKIKEDAIKVNKQLNCEICGFSFMENYGKIGEGFIEAHHKKSFEENKEVHLTTKKDIALVCSNCHRMLHRGESLMSIDELKRIISDKN